MNHKEGRARADREYYLKNRDAIIRRNSRYQKDHPDIRKKSNRKYYLNNRDTIIQRNSLYQKQHPNNRKTTNRKYYETHKEQFKQRSKIYYAQNKRDHHVRQLASSIPLKNNCQQCGVANNLVRHHPDYSKPLEVVTLCHSCHRNLHLGSKEA